jgi:methionyl-tRNA formyltransferase
VTRVLFMGYHTLGAECLEALLDSPEAEVVGVFTHPEDPSENVWFRTPAPVAEDAGVPVSYPETLKTEDARRLVKDLAPDIIFSVYYRLMVPENILRLPRLGAINLHGSLLPKYRGRVPVNWAIINGETETGATLHYMTAKPDAGDIIDQVRVMIKFEDTAVDLFNRVIDAGAELFRRDLPSMLAGTCPRRPQDEAAATYFGGRKPEDGLIDWRKPALAVYNLVRAVTRPYPGAFAYLPDGRKLTVWRCAPVENAAGRGREPGEVFREGADVMVACVGETAIKLIEVEESAPEAKPSGQKAVQAVAWLESRKGGPTVLRGKS